MKMTRRGLFSGIVTTALAASGALLPKSAGPPVSWLPPSSRPVPLITISSLSKRPMPPAHALERFLTRYAQDFLVPAWGTPAAFVWADAPDPATWNLTFTDTDEELGYGALAYHNFDVTKFEQPYAIIGVQASLAYEGNVTVPATHELAEMLVNPGIGYWADTQIPEDGTLLALESADPVQDISFDLGGLQASDFVMPAYFEPWRDGRVDYCGAIQNAHQITRGGYQIVRAADGKIDSIYGARALPCARLAAIKKRAPRAVS